MLHFTTTVAVGNIGKIEEIKTFPNGTPYVRFSLAIRNHYTNAQGEKEVSTEWHKAYVMKELANNFHKNYAVGQNVLINGRLRSRPVVDRGSKRTVTEIEVNFIQRNTDTNS